MQKHQGSKSQKNLVISKQHQKIIKSEKILQVNNKISVKTSLERRLKSNDGFLKPKKYEKGLSKSAQQHDQKHLFKNSQIKKSIELHRHQLEKVQTKQNHQRRSLQSEQKFNRDAYYGNTTTSQTKSNKKSSKSKLSQKSKLSESKVIVKYDKQTTCKKNQQSSRQKNTLKSPPALSRKKQPSVQKKEQKRLKKLEQEYIKMLEEKLQQKEAQLNTIKTRNMLEQTRGFGGWTDELSQQEMRRLRKIHKTEEEIFEMKINQIRRQILTICERQKNEVLCFGGYECEDVLSFIQGKD